MDENEFYQTAQFFSNEVDKMNNLWSQDEQWERQYSLAQENNQWARDTQTQLANLQAHNEYDLWLKQLNYNSYKTKMEQLRQAGINPYVAAGKVANVQDAGIHAQSAPSVHPTALPYQPYYMPVDTVSGLASAYQALSQSDLNKQQAKRIGDLLAGEVEGQTLDNAAKKFGLEMDIAFEGLERNANLQKVKQDIKTSMELAFKYAEEGDLANYQKYKEDALRYLYSVQGKIEQKKYDRIDEYINGELRVLDSQVFKNTEEGKAARASSFASLAQAQDFIADAAYKRSQTKTEDGLRDAKVAIESLTALMTGAKTYQEFVHAKYSLLHELKDLQAKDYLNQAAFLKYKQDIFNYQYRYQNTLGNQVAWPITTLFK